MDLPEDLAKEVAWAKPADVKAESDYQAALREIECLMTAEFDTPEGERLDVLVTLVEAYEQCHFPLDQGRNRVCADPA